MAGNSSSQASQADRRMGLGEIDRAIQSLALITADFSEKSKSDILEVSERSKNDILQVVDSEIRRVLAVANGESTQRIVNIRAAVGELYENSVLALAEKNEILEKKEQELKTLKCELNEFKKVAKYTISYNAVHELKVLVGTEKEGLKEWGFFLFKVCLEIYLSVLEPFAAAGGKRNKGDWMKRSGISVAVVLLFLTIVEIVMQCMKRPCFEDKRCRMRRIRWIPDIYGFIISVMAIILFAISFKKPAALHIAFFVCAFTFCLFMEKCGRACTSRERAYEVEQPEQPEQPEQQVEQHEEQEVQEVQKEQN